ncbi:serine recombinase [Clostridium sp. K25]|uniref:recombinase family protein n=1 Tax=Clostridium sp. K25 TaxID=1443109 RepID=UPI0004D38FF6|nr:recombinase family protein [Clostridium sp. K25]KEI11051.1 serine recombinase [Clostridium sp. K25]
MKVAAIYTRKSKYTGKGESIDNQVKICKEHLSKNNISNFIIYEDEGFSGKNTERPKFQTMLKDAKDKKFDILICYRLDRVSRNIADFSYLIQKLEKYDISFISVSEQFDTSTPMGRAMMYIASVFAQLERETIAERIKDNMVELAKSGRWLGGRTPTGFKSTPITTYDNELNERKMFMLSPINEELKLVKLLFKLYLEKKSLSQVVKYLLSHNIKTKMDNNWSKTNVLSILTNPVYVKTTDEVFDYLNSKNIHPLGTPDGVHGMLSYNKRKGKSGPSRDLNEHIYSVAKHEGIIESHDWLKVQNILEKNTSKAPRLGKTHTALLTGIMRCGVCGSHMKIAYGSINKKTGKRHYYYICSLKRDSGCTRCNNKNIRGDIIENILIEKLKEMTLDEGVFINELKRHQEELYGKNSTLSKIDELKKQIAIKDTSIENLLKSISLTQDKNISQILVNKLEEISKEKLTLENTLNQYENRDKKNVSDNKNFDTIIYSLRNFKSLIDISNIYEKRLLISTIVDKIYWYGDKEIMDVRFWGAETIQ